MYGYRTGKNGMYGVKWEREGNQKNDMEGNQRSDMEAI